MKFLSAKIITAIIVIVALLGVGLVLFSNKKVPDAPVGVVPRAVLPEIIGKSVEGRNLESYTFGTGPTHLLFVGGIHGGYEWNSVVLAYKFIDYLNANVDFVPKDITISVIPSANPDGLFKVMGKDGYITLADRPTAILPDGTGRFNAHDVDINRNFDCDWQAKSTWKSKAVSAGTMAFSEPEARAIRDYVSTFNPAAAIFWHSQANGVYASKCDGNILPVTLAIMNSYAAASGYNAIKTFDAYPVTGASEDWLASKGIPAITVELKTHETIEWTQNLAGINSILSYFSR